MLLQRRTHPSPCAAVPAAPRAAGRQPARTLLPLLLLAPLVAAGPTLAQPAPAPAGSAPTPAAAALIEPAAMAALQGMAEFLATRPAWSVQLRTGYDVVQEDGQKIEFAERRRILVSRPRGLRVESLASNGDTRIITFDGATVTVVDPVRKLYAQAEKAGDLDSAVPYFVSGLRMRLPLALLLVSNLPRELNRRVTEVREVEVESTTGAPYRHIAARTDGVDLQVWIAATGDPLPRRLVLTYRHEVGQSQYRADFTDWNLAPTVAATAFTAELPADASRIAFLTQTLPAAATAPAPTPAPAETQP